MEKDIGENKKRGILAVSFGTSYEDSCRQTIGALEEDFAENFPGIPVKRAFTSSDYHADLGRAGSYIFRMCRTRCGNWRRMGLRFLSSPPIYWREKSMKSCAPGGEPARKLSPDGHRRAAIAYGGRICTELQILCQSFFQEKRGEALVLMGHGSQA